MASQLIGDSELTHYDDVVGVELTIDGMLVVADRLHLVDFPLAHGQLTDIVRGSQGDDGVLQLRASAGALGSRPRYSPYSGRNLPFR